MNRATGKALMSPTDIPFNRPSLVGREISYLEDAIHRGQLSGDGYYTKKCNDVLTRLTGASTALLNAPE